MTSKKINFIAIATIFLSSSIFTGCGNNENSKKDKVYFLRGAKLESERKFENAEKFYIKAFLENNKNNDVIYRLGFLYECYLNQPELAIYYYKKLLECNISEVEKTNINEKISNIEKDKKINFENSEAAAKLNATNIELNNRIKSLSEEIEILTNKNKQLIEFNKRLIAKYQQPQKNNLPPVQPKVENDTKEKDPKEQLPSNIYVVQTGDNLGRIASKKYGSTKDWRLILEANKDLLKNNEKNLRPGMKLIIPNIINEKVEQKEEDDDDTPKG